MRRNFGSAIRGTAFTLTVCGLLLICANGFAVGGACPSQANYLNASTNTLVTLSSLGVTNCYYVSAAGADTNNGTSEAAPWLHAPGMPNCAGNCATAWNGTLPAGIGIILRGGDTWHFGNSSASPYTGGTWNFNASPYPNGTSSNPIYIGVDQSWYSGSSWMRPILTGDNPLTPNPGTLNDSVASCAYQMGSNNNMFGGGSLSYITFDNFEMTGLCQNDLNSAAVKDVYVIANSSTGFIASNLYIHGWTHLAFSCVAGSPPTGHCFEIFAFYGPMNLNSDIVDGSDSDPSGAGMSFGNRNTSNTVFRNVAQFVGNPCHILHDTLFDYIYDPGDGEAHGNVYECVGEASGTNAYYNNILRNIYPSGVVGVNFWIGPSAGTTDYFFNNLFYNIPGGGNNLNIQNASGGPVYAFNNTFQTSQGSVLFDCEGGSNTTSINDHFITDAGSPYYNGTCTTATNLLQSNAVANGQGYTSSETFAYSPTSGGSTIGAGTNETSGLCAALATAAASDATLSDAATACLSDTRYACTYNTSNHTVTCPARTAVARPSSGAWDVGAHQYGGSPAVAPPIVSPPTAH